MTRTTPDPLSLGQVRKVSAEATRRMASRLDLRPSLNSQARQRSEHRLVDSSLIGSGLRLGAMLLMLPLGLALATGGAWQPVVWMGAALVAAGLWTVYEDVKERRSVERIGVEAVGVELVGVLGEPGGLAQPQPTPPQPVSSTNA